MNEQDRVSRIRSACVQKRITGFRISGVLSMKDRMVGWLCEISLCGSSATLEVTSAPGGSVRC